MNEADGVFLLGPPLNLGLFDMLSPFLDYLEESGPKRVVYLSAYGMELMKGLHFHQQMEDKLKDSSLDWTVLRPGFFMQNFGNYERENIEQRKIIFSPAGEGKTAFVSAVDIGTAIAHMLTEKGHTGKTYKLLGDELLSYFDVANKLTSILGETIVYPNPDDATYRKVLNEGGAPDFIANYMISVYALIRHNQVSDTSGDLREIIKRSPEKLEEVLLRDFK